MTALRAKYVLDNSIKIAGNFGGFYYAFDSHLMREDGITREENEFIMMMLEMMDGSKSYYDAVVAIAGGI